MNAYAPAELTGLWSRELITAPGLRDDTTRVLWLQTRSWYVDLRVPAGRPNAGGRRALADFSAAELVELARIEGFAGELSVNHGVCFWRRDLDRQPPAATPDEGRFALSGDLMIEDGVHLDYQETWRRQADSTAPLFAFRLEQDPAGRRGLLVGGGRHMLEFLSPPGPALPQGATLVDLVAAELGAGRRGAAEGLLSARIRHATLDDGAWTTRLSSLPWLEGEPMWPAGGARFDQRDGLLEVQDDAGALRWRLIDASPAATALVLPGA